MSQRDRLYRPSLRGRVRDSAGNNEKVTRTIVFAITPRNNALIAVNRIGCRKEVHAHRRGSLTDSQCRYEDNAILQRRSLWA